MFGGVGVGGDVVCGVVERVWLLNFLSEEFLFVGFVCMVK